MQEREFDKLMNFEPAKWADMFNPTDTHPLQPVEADDFHLTLIPGESKKEQREKIKAAEKPIPKHIEDAIHKYVKEERAKKTSERAIRRAVKRKWNIYVV